MRLRREAGEGLAGCVVWLVILSFIALIVVKMVPVKVKSADLKDFMVEQAKFAGVRTQATEVHKRIHRKAQELGLPVTKKDVVVKYGGGRIRMTVKYTVPVDLLFYTYQWEFNHEVDRPVFIV